MPFVNIYTNLPLYEILRAPGVFLSEDDAKAKSKYLRIEDYSTYNSLFTIKLSAFIEAYPDLATDEDILCLETSIANFCTDEENINGPFFITTSLGDFNWRNYSSSTVYETAREAQAYGLKVFDGPNEFLSFKGRDISTYQRRFYYVVKLSWQAREHLRFARSDYNKLPWADFDDIGIQQVHFAHRSSQNPHLIAFTESEDKGMRDIQTVMKPGRYLNKFYSDKFSEKTILRMAEFFTTGAYPKPNDLSKLDFATTPEAIEQIYIEGPQSCMSGEEGFMHKTPVRVYGAGDLAIAYMMRGGKPTVRALCWPKHKVYGRIYPTADRWEDDGFSSQEESESYRHALETELIEAGYEYGRFDGAHILAIPARTEAEDDGWVVPYIDGPHYLKNKRVIYKDKLCFVIANSPGYPASETDGVMPDASGYTLEDTRFFPVETQNFYKGEADLDFEEYDDEYEEPEEPAERQDEIVF